MFHFLQHYKLPAGSHRLELTQSSSSTKLTGPEVHRDTRDFQLFITFPLLTKPSEGRDPVTDSVVHHIVTNGPPTTSRPHRLTSDKLVFSKSELVTYYLYRSFSSQSSDFATEHGFKKGWRQLKIMWWLWYTQRGCQFRHLSDNLHTRYLGVTSRHDCFNKIGFVEPYHQITIVGEEVEKMHHAPFRFAWVPNYFFWVGQCCSGNLEIDRYNHTILGFCSGSYR